MENLVAIELAYINTKHPDFHKDAALVSSLLKGADDHLKHNKRLTTSTIVPIDTVSNNLYSMFFLRYFFSESYNVATLSRYNADNIYTYICLLIILYAPLLIL